MKIELEIPKKYEEEFANDKFHNLFADIIWSMSYQLDSRSDEINKMIMIDESFQCATVKKT